jgi:endo-1,4-beta-xylanase
MYLSILLLIFSLLSLSALQAQTPDPKFDDYLASVRELLPADGALVYDCSTLSGYIFGVHGNNTITPMNTDDDKLPFSQAYRITVNDVGDYWWETRFASPANIDAISQGDMLFWVFYARTIEVHQEGAEAKMVFQNQLTEPPWKTIIHADIFPETGWTRYYAYGKAPFNYDPGKLQGSFFFEFVAQTIEVGGFIALNLGQDIDPESLPPNEAMVDPKFNDYLASVRELLPVDGTLLFDGTFTSTFHHWGHGANTIELFQADEEMPFSHAWRAAITDVEWWWKTGFEISPNTSAIQEGDMLFWVFYARTNEVDELIGLAKAHFAFQTSEPPFMEILQMDAYPQTGWTRFYVYKEAPANYEPGALRGIVHLEYFPQIIEFGGFIGLNLGQGIDPADLPRNEAMIDPKFDENLASVRELLPVDGTLLYDCASLDGYKYYGTFPDNMLSMINTENDDVPFGRAFRLNTSSFTPGLFEQLIFPKNETPVQWNDMVFMVFYARSVIPKQETGRAMHAGCGTSSYGSREITSLSLRPPGDEWTPYYLFGRARQVYEIGELLTFFFFSHSPQTIDIGGFIALNLGQDINSLDLPYTVTTYPGREEDAPWRATAAERIEEHRKGDLLVQVVDDEGVSVSDAIVSVEMKRHEFKFGTSPAWMSDILQGAKWDMYREQLFSLFNAVTAGFFMGNDDYGWYAQPSYRTGVVALTKWLKQNNMSISGTTLIYPGWALMPSFIIDLADDPEALHTALIHHLDTIVPIGRDAGVEMWDVINEQTITHDVMDILGDEVLIDWFEHVHFLHPEAQLSINDFNILMGGGDPGQHANLKYLINMLQDANAPIHRVGFQSHFNNYLPSIERIFEILEDFSVYDLNIHISEFDIDIYDEEAQADYTRDFMTIIFSHPSVDRFTHWGFWEATMYIPNGAMFRVDWSEKPNYHAYTDLVFNQWWTEEEGLSDENGGFFVRGFLGDYEITAVKDHLSATLDTVLVKDGTTITLVLAEPPVTYNLDLDVNPPGTAVVTGAGEYESGTQINISAIADSDWIFVNWTGDTDHVDHLDSAMAIVNMPASNVSLTAHFEYTGILLNLNVDMRRVEDFNPNEDVVHVTGSMLDWAIPVTNPDNQLMTRLGETMIWNKTFYLEEGEYEYKYFLNNGWDNGEWSGITNRNISVEDDMTVYNAWGMMGEAFLVNFSVKNENDHTIDDAVIIVNSFSYNAGEYEIGYLPSGQYEYYLHHNDFGEVTGHFSISGEAVWVNVLMTADDTAINDMEVIDIKIFPNPVQNTLFVEANMMITDILVIDIPGRPVLSVKVQDKQNELDLSGLYNGMYFIRVFTGKGVQTIKIQIIR